MIKTNTVIFLIASSVLAVTHYFSIELYLYWRYLWLDLIVHALGGSVVALGYLTIPDFLPKLSPRWFGFLQVLFFVLAIAILWEVFEATFGLFMAGLDRWELIIDTTSDLGMGLVGGMIGYLVGSRLRQLT